MADDRYRVAVRTIAARVVVHACGPATPVEPDWENYPELTEHQWLQVTTEVGAIVDALSPSEDEFVAAYEYLTGETP